MRLNDATRYFEDESNNLCLLKVRHPKLGRATIARLDGSLASVDVNLLTPIEGHYADHPQWKQFLKVWFHKKLFGG